MPAGYYSVEVKDVLGEFVKGEITLTEPEPLKVLPTVSSFANGHNISCFECNNGYIQLATSQGTPPYSYAWSDGPSTSQNRYSLGPKQYTVTVTDANGCQERAVVKITQPERRDWTMEGNAGTNPASQYIGTSDSKDVVFKANGQESVRLKANGDISLLGSLSGSGPLYRDALGDIKLWNDVFPPIPVGPCALDIMPLWPTDGLFLNTCSGCRGRFGSRDACDVNFISNNVTRIRLMAGGQFQLGGDLETWSMSAVPARMNIQQGHGTWLALHTRASTPGGAEAHWGIHNPPEQNKMAFYFQPASGDAVFNLLNLHPDGKVSIGDVSIETPNYNYKLYVEGGLLTEKVKVTLKTSSEWSDHVFLPGYRLMPLKDVAVFVKKNGHLPNVPSADQMVEQGLDVVKTDAMLLEKIEEITLHLIAMELWMDELVRENFLLRRTVSRNQKTNDR